MKSTAVDENLSSMNQQFCSRENQLLQKEEQYFAQKKQVKKKCVLALITAGKHMNPGIAKPMAGAVQDLGNSITLSWYT